MTVRMRPRPACWGHLPENVQLDWLFHDQSCCSLNYVWCSCSPAELGKAGCSDCHMNFTRKGVGAFLFGVDACCLCECCARRKGLIAPWVD